MAVKARTEGGTEKRTTAERRLPSFDAGSLRAYGLSRREIAVLELVARGDTNVQTASHLGISPLTVKKHLERMYAAVGARNRAELIALTYERGRAADPASDRRARPSRHNLPASLTSFIGRERELDELTSLIRRARLVTLGGPGGIGKTRLALEVAARMAGTFADGVWLVELGDLVDERLVVQAVSTTFGLRESSRSRLAALTDGLRSKELLLVLDNCEQVTHACAAMVEPLLRACPDLRVLATSRETLGVDGEVFWPVPSLSLPEVSATSGAAALATIEGSEAVRLFVERASLRSPRFALMTANGGAIAHICRRLDGVPLAIELAAARLNVLSVQEIAARLDDRFDELRTDAPEALPRHRTLRGVIDWSYQLLGRAERRLFERLAVFAGGCTHSAAEFVCMDEEVEAHGVLDLLSRLVDKSFVSLDVQRGETRYRMLETVQVYGRDRLAASGGADVVRARHAAYFCSLAEESEPKLKGKAQLVWFARLEADHDNLRAALQWSLDREPETALRLTGALWRFWFHRGHSREGARWLEAALAADLVAPALRGKALNGAGHLAHALGQVERSMKLHREALALRRTLCDRQGISASLSNLADRVREAGHLAEARVLYEESIELKQELGDTWGLAVTTSGLGHVALAQGDFERAEQTYLKALTLIRRAGDVDRSGHFLAFLGHAAREQGRLRRAADLYRRSLVIFRHLGDRVGLEDAVMFLGLIAAIEGRREHAAKLLGAAAAARSISGRSGGEYTVAAEVEALRSLRKDVSDRDLAAALARGQSLPFDTAIQHALSRSD